MATHKQQWNKRHGYDKDASHSLAEIARVSKIPVATLKKVYERGEGAYSNNLKSVRMKGSYKKNVEAPASKKLSMAQWSQARVYAFVNKIEKGVKLNHDTDLLPSKK